MSTVTEEVYRSDASVWCHPKEFISELIDAYRSIPASNRVNAKLEIDATEEYGCPVVKIRMTYERPETEDESRRRAYAASMSDAHRKEQEFRLFTFLKAKYEGGT